MQKRQWIKKGKSKEENVEILKQYFETDNLSHMIEDNSFLIACRCIKRTEMTKPAIMAWAQMARIKARGILYKK